MSKRNRRLIGLLICNVGMAGLFGLSLIMSGMVSAGGFILAVGVVGAIVSVIAWWKSADDEGGN